MALPRTAPNSWMQSLDFPSKLFEIGSNDYELYEQDDEFVLSVELPGFEPGEITASWDDGVLNIVAEHDDKQRGERRTYHRRFRFPKTVDEKGITATYDNGILDVRLPVEQTRITGREIEIEAA